MLDPVAVGVSDSRLVVHFPDFFLLLSVSCATCLSRERDKVITRLIVFRICEWHHCTLRWVAAAVLTVTMLRGGDAAAAVYWQPLQSVGQRAKMGEWQKKKNVLRNRILLLLGRVVM